MPPVSTGRHRAIFPRAGYRRPIRRPGAIQCRRRDGIPRIRRRCPRTSTRPRAAAEGSIVRRIGPTANRLRPAGAQRQYRQRDLISIDSLALLDQRQNAIGEWSEMEADMPHQCAMELRPISTPSRAQMPSWRSRQATSSPSRRAARRRRRRSALAYSCRRPACTCQDRQSPRRGQSPRQTVRAG